VADSSKSRQSDTDAIRFVLDGEIIEIENVDPTRTVLQYLREDLRRTGTKEGCAEGDCGACTVVVAELNSDGDDVDLRAINSCIQFLPTLDGKELISVESLASDSANLHPVQESMLDCHGSQCGFCTPGFVMSLFALYKTNAEPARRDIDDALAGNLCRCTGYRPIIAAAQSMYERESADSDDWLRQPCGKTSPPRDRVEKLKSLERESQLTVSGDGRSFIAPMNAGELATALRDNPDATILAGGTDVGLWVTKQHRVLTSVIYTGQVSELRDLSVNDSYIEIGAAVSLSDAVPVIVEHYPDLHELFIRFASPPIRNAGTLGGNIANGSPIGDSMPALMAAGAKLVLRSSEGSREVSLDDFYHDYMVNDLEPGEFLESLRLPLPEAGVELRSYKISKRFDQDISAVCAAFRLKLEGGKVAGVRIAFGGMAATIRRALKCEEALQGQEWNEATVERAMDALAKDFEPIGDMRASADYRQRVSRNFLKRLYLESQGGTNTTVYDYGRTG
jgi:xanthine dehydrogenase small subunit